MHHLILIGLLAAVALPARAEIPLDVAEVVQTAQLVRNGHATPLQMRQPLTDGDAIRTGDWRSSVTLHFVRDGVLTLGPSSELFVDGASPPSLGRGDVLRAQLVRGELTLEAYPPSNTVPKDYRLTIGPLQVRALGADLWAYVNSNSETVCVHQGALEITSSAGQQRLDFAGDCLQHKIGRPPQIMPGAETELRDRLLVAEQSPANAGASPAAASVMAPVSMPVAAKASTPAPAAPVAATVAASAPVPASVPMPASDPAPRRAIAKAVPRWIIVLATARSRADAEDAAYKFAKRTLRTTVRETGKAPPFSVTFGDFATKKEADQFAQKLRRKYRLKIIRVAALS